MVNDDRAQGHTLEGVAAALLIISSIVFALQVTAVTPLTASTASQHIETQNERASTGVLAIAANERQIGPTIRYWNESGARFHDAAEVGYYIGRAPNTSFGDQLRTAFGEAGIAYNVEVTYLDRDGARHERRVVYFGQPSDTAVTASRIVVLSDSQPILDRNGNTTNVTLEEANYFAPDAYEGHLYNVVVVEVTIWRM